MRGARSAWAASLAALATLLAFALPAFGLPDNAGNTTETFITSSSVFFYFLLLVYAFVFAFSHFLLFVSIYSDSFGLLIFTRL